METKDKIHLAIKTAGLPTPRETVVSKTEIVMTYGGDATGMVSAIIGILQENKINFIDPRSNTSIASVVADTNTTAKTIITLPLINEAAYNKILSKAEDKDGDGKKELPQALDTDGDGKADDTGAKIKK